MLKPSVSIGQQVYDFVLEKIQYGQFSSGERITENQIADLLQASRMPVREAFRRLEQDGILERTPQRGMRVTVLTPETLKEIFGIRSLLEPYAIKLACENRQEAHITELRFIETQARQILDDPEKRSPENYKLLFNLTTRFHDVIYQAANSQYLMRLLSNMHHAVLRLRNIGMQRKDTWLEVWDEHSKLIGYMEKRDTKAAAETMLAHVGKAAEYAMSSLKEETK